jgi:hypothetical protein
VKVRFNIRGYIDRRSLDLHLRYDGVLTRRFELRVARSPKERARLEKLRTQEPPR